MITRSKEAPIITWENISMASGINFIAQTKVTMTPLKTQGCTNSISSYHNFSHWEKVCFCENEDY